MVDGNDGGSCLVLESVIGSTVFSNNALSAADANSFAFCAGSFVVLAVINEQLGFDQRLISVKPDALPIQATPTYYNPATPTKATGTRSYVNLPFKDDAPFGTALSPPIDHNTDFHGRAKATCRSRNLSCLSLSPSGKFLTVGEVYIQTISDFMM